jgi:4-amino-4-deoxy-L-arabinose transferase-like glycosyltransferase
MAASISALKERTSSRAVWLTVALAIAIFIFAFTVRYVTLAGPGITWDEPTYVHSSISYVGHLLHFELSPAGFNDNSEQPPVAKYIYGAALWAFNGGEENYNAFVIVKLVSAVMGSVTCVLVFLMGREFFDTKVGFLSAAILALIPDFVAHTQIGALDSPVALFFTLTLFLFMLAVKRNSRAYYVASAVSLGLLVDTKLNGLLAIPVMALFFIAQRHSLPGTEKKSIGELIGHYVPVKPVLAFFSITAALDIAIYPWIWGGMDNIKETISHWAYAPMEYFLGNYGPAPWSYYPVYFLATTPELLFIPLALGIYFVLRSRDPYKLAVLLLFLVPFAYTLSSFKQDGMRYLLMIYPAVALLCGTGISGAAAAAGKAMKSGRAANTTFAVLGALAIVYLILVLASVSPYYLDYYNGLVGGVSNVNDKKMLEVGWWGEGIYDSVMYIERTAPVNSLVFVAAEPSHVIYPYRHNAIYKPFNNPVKYVTYDFDYILTNTYSDRYSRLVYNQDNYTLVYETKVQGVPLARVFKKVA